jgi:predicted regulator of Ras-like GTPase activity (Roadblock/LC7/MglB family)
MLAQMTDATASGLPTEADAAAALARFEEMSADLRGAAIVDSKGAVLAATGERERWRDVAGELLAAADAVAPGQAARAHVGTEDGEAFAVRQGELAIVAVAERFTLASLMLFDMRAVLRDAATGAVSE